MRFPKLTGDASRRMHGLQSALRDRARDAHMASQWPELDERFKASLRGKRKAYLEAAEMVAAVERGWCIPWNRGWRARTPRDPEDGTP